MEALESKILVIVAKKNQDNTELHNPLDLKQIKGVEDWVVWVDLEAKRVNL